MGAAALGNTPLKPIGLRPDFHVVASHHFYIIRSHVEAQKMINSYA